MLLYRSRPFLKIQVVGVKYLLFDSVFVQSSAGVPVRGPFTGSTLGLNPENLGEDHDRQPGTRLRNGEVQIKSTISTQMVEFITYCSMENKEYPVNYKFVILR